MIKPALLALADGNVFAGTAVGVSGVTCGEVVFNTAMTGYQEILTDPSYAHQLITLTYPHIGNVGVNVDDAEAREPWASGLIIRDLPAMASNWRSQMSLDIFLKRHGIVAIADVDTRELTRHIRTHGAQSGCIVTGNVSADTAIAKARAFAGLDGADLAKVVTTDSRYLWTDGSWQPGIGYQHYSGSQLPYHVVAYDFGIKRNILRLLADRGMRVTVVPATTSAQEVMALQPHGVFLSNGPGDPSACDYAIDAVKMLLAESIPLFGICLGCQLLALASGGRTYKMKFGHHGANHPVQALQTGKVFITSQNHGFAIDEASLPSTMTITHRSLFDNTVQGIQSTLNNVIGFQGHPEASPGPHDIIELFDQFATHVAAYANGNDGSSSITNTPQSTAHSTKVTSHAETS